MPVENAMQQRLMEARARALATVLLTRRADVLVHDGDGTDFDFCATLESDKAGLRQLGVELKWQLDPLTAEQGNGWLRDRDRWTALTAAGPFPFPVVVFFFTMQDDGAWYTWAAEPVVGADGRAKLPLRAEPDCRPLTAGALDDILARVDVWYDAHYAALAPVVSGSR